MLIYRLINSVTGKCYIGLTKQTPKERFQGHKEHVAKGTKTALYDSMRKYGIEAFSMQIVAELIPSLDFDDLKELEKSIIAQENTMVPFGYNLTAGGDGTVGYKMKPEQLKRNPASEETKRKMSLARKGKVCHTEESKKKISAVHKGKVVSEETLKKMRIAAKARWTPERKKSVSDRMKITSTSEKMSAMRFGRKVA